MTVGGSVAGPGLHGAVDRALVQRRTVQTLVISQAIGSVGITVGVATASLLAKEISGSEAQAGLAQTFQTAGTAAAAYLLASVMGRRGRRHGMVLGLLLGAVGAFLAVVSGVLSSMPVLLIGAVLMGATSAANQASRYAATDLAEPAHRGRALALVVGATTIGAVAGPNLTGVGASLARAMGLPVLTGGFAIAAVVMVVSAAWVFWRLRPDPLLVHQAFSEASGAPPRQHGGSFARTRAAVRATPSLGVAIAAMACAHAAMVSVMVMTPLHMEHGGAELDVIGFVISVHVLGMFAFSPLVGMAADRFGRGVVLVVGGVVLLAAMVLCAAAPEGNSWQIWAGLFLLGLGWSCATVAGSTVLADLTPVEARTDVQGVGDMTMSLVAAGGGGLSGVIVAVWGFPVLAGFAAILGFVVIGAGIATRRTSIR